MESHDHLFKVLIIGDTRVGKTSLVHRYVHEKFFKCYKNTVGVDFALKALTWSDTETVRLQLWDIAGQERFTSMTRIYYKGASGCVLMFDVTSTSSFHSCQKWKEDLDSKVLQVDGNRVPCILLANKCDLSPWQVSKEDVETFSKTSGFIAWMETSVKDNRNIAESMRILAENMMANQSAFGTPENQGTSFKLSSPVTAKVANGDPCCSTMRNLVE
ncbi:ras-related protein Rab-7L1-like [Brienomyrus brachyistius]|uniref:ras-related protein Rab-7L1-like n=1 Tax=Brienomyrus brachyistius TaxID=42636 RepID=UPI0020B2CB2B|nr:ras-related protein Rab-7L1-like [Brienomyrus brachyistius]